MSRLGKLTKIVYAISLLTVNAFHVLVVVVIGIIIGHRFYELLMGRIILFSHNASSFVNIMRNIGLLLIYLSTMTVIGGMMLLIGFDLYFHNHVKITHLFSGDDIEAVFRYSSPTALGGLIIFEFSRLKNFEYHSINR